MLEKYTWTWGGLNYILNPLILQPDGGKVGVGTKNPERLLHLSTDDGKCIILQSPKGGEGNTVSLDFQTYKNGNNQSCQLFPCRQLTMENIHLT
jgi:hypothetical protein